MTAPNRRWFHVSLMELFFIVLIVAVAVGLIMPAMKHSENTPPGAAKP